MLPHTIELQNLNDIDTHWSNDSGAAAETVQTIKRRQVHPSSILEGYLPQINIISTAQHTNFTS